MAIDPNIVTTVKVGDLPSADFNLTDKIPHEIGDTLFSGTIQKLADVIGDYLGTSDALAFNPTTVMDGGTLPSTSSNEWMLVGKGTFHNVGGGLDIVTTEELNAITSNGSYWSLAVQIPINVELAGITQNIRSGYTETTPSENAVFNALALKLNVSDFVIPNHNELEGLQGGAVNDYQHLTTNEKTNIFESNKKWVLFGDSISNTLVDPDYPYYTIQKLGLTGTVTNAVAGNVSGQQLTILQGLLSGNPNYFDNFDIATLLVGVNDWATNVPLGGRNSASSDDTYAGHIKKIIELILTAKPTLRLYVMTPFEMYYADPVNGPINSEGYTLRDMSVLVSQICSDYSVQCIDLYSTVQINKITIPALLSDGIHPNSAGAKIIGDLVADAFLSKSNIGNITDLSTGGDIPNGKFLSFGDTSPSNSILRILSKDGYNYIQTGKGGSSGTANDLIFTGNYGANELLRLKANAELVSQNTVTSTLFDTSSTVNNPAYSIAGYPFARFSTGDVLEIGAFAITWNKLRIMTSGYEAMSFDDGTVTIPALSGTQTEIVTADLNGNLGKGGAAPTSGTYTPTYVAGTNVTSLTNITGKYSRIGNLVTVFFRCSVVVSSATSATDFTVTFPASMQKAPGDSPVFSGSWYGVTGPTSGDITSVNANAPEFTVSMRAVSNTNTTLILQGSISYMTN